MLDFLDPLFDLFGVFGDCADMSRAEKYEYEAKLAAEDARAKAAEIERALAEGKWLCECGYINTKHTSECSSCGRYKKLAQNNRTYVDSDQTVIGASADTWLCSKCGSLNENTDICPLCGIKK